MRSSLVRGRFFTKVSCLISAIILIYIIFNHSHYLKHFDFSSHTKVTVRSTRHLSKLLTVVFRQFEDFENDIADSVQSFVAAFPNVQVLVVSNRQTYPPFPFSATKEALSNVKLLSLEFKLNLSHEYLNPLSHIGTDFVLFVPDSTRVSRKVLQHAMTKATQNTSNAVAIGVGNSELECSKISFRLADWALRYHRIGIKEACDVVRGPHCILVWTSLLKQMPDPFMLPFPEAFYLQSASRNIKVHILNETLAAGRNILKSPTSKQRSLKYHRERHLNLYKKLGVKVIIEDTNKITWYGCKKDTQRCFPSVQEVPSFILAGRHTPPCCRRNIRHTINHVLDTLIANGVTCWLETTTLLGAVTRNDILPWVEYGEIGIHASDVPQLEILTRGGVDKDGYLWERATKGRYYRVAYSNTNKVYTMVLPFVGKNGTMWPDDWVMGHQKHFSERHLNPLAQITFSDRLAPAPNDARVFLDSKLGPKAIERCKLLGHKLLYN